jgi:Questin oxidase-like
MDTLDEAYERFMGSGPEWGEDTLTNHGPMAAEVLVRRGRRDELGGWVDRYARRLDDLPRPSDPIRADGWADALGDMRRIGDWTEFFTREVAERPWRDVLVTWWPRLLPGIVAGTTHGVIRTGHAVRALSAAAAGAAAAAELAHGLAFWAARYLAVPGAVPPAGGLPAAAALDGVTRIPAQSGRVSARLGQLAGMSAWPTSLAALRAPADPDDARALLSDLVTAATVRYRTHGHASPVLLVHTATAPNAVLHTLPELPRELWAPSLAAVWAVTAAVIATYAPVQGAPEASLPAAPGGDDPAGAAIDAAVAHGDEHVIKFTDTAAEVYARTGDPRALSAAVRITDLIGAPS